MIPRPAKLPLLAVVDVEVAVTHASLAVGKDSRPTTNTRKGLVPTGSHPSWVSL